MKTALTIAGSDSSGGAGIQADIKTMTANGVFAMSAITALTAQNTTGVTDIFETTPRFLAEQLDAIFTDIYPDAVKIGMVSSAELIDTIAEKLHAYEAKHIVVDPVMVATSGSKLLRDDAVQALTAKLLPMAEVLTPNIPEAEILSGMTISDAAGMEAAAKAISEKYGCAVLCKGGHQINDADDLLWRSGTGKWFHGKRIANPNTHGTGCTLSSAIASNLAKGCDLDTSVERAKAYISGCLSAMLDLGGNVTVIGAKEDGSPWRVAVKDPRDTGSYLCVLALTDVTLSTSGGYERYFEEDGVRYHHIIDPETGYPADSGLLSVTVVSADHLLADALSTALFVAGPEEALDFWRSRDDFELVLCTGQGELLVTEGLEDVFTFAGADRGYTYEIARR